ncbi:MAG: DegT/DnrJ/EryC1/StrS family aminotransferase, partial [Candidatus Eremiobacterota bacterium]
LPTGRFSLAASFSFFFSHHITTMEGGMAVTDDDDLAELFRCLRAHGWTRQLRDRQAHERRHSELDPRFLFVNLGYNLRPTDVQAAFGLHQLPRLEDFNRRRAGLAARLCLALESLSQHLQLVRPTAEVEHTWMGFPVLLRRDRRPEFVAHLEARGVETRPIVAGNLARQPALAHFPHRVAGRLEAADAVMRRGVYWGLHPGMTDEDVDYVARTLEDFFR